ncbi:MAG: hypothetical protein R3Y53_00305 [Bacillota bacterium]
MVVDFIGVFVESWEVRSSAVRGCAVRTCAVSVITFPAEKPPTVSAPSWVVSVITFPAEKPPTVSAFGQLTLQAKSATLTAVFLGGEY